jgi:segregation and condensation protein A
VHYGQRVTVPPVHEAARQRPDRPASAADAVDARTPLVHGRVDAGTADGNADPGTGEPDPDTAATDPLPGGEAVVAPAEPAPGFTVRLANFTGPFDLLLQLIGKHKLDVTEVALHQVTDEFIAYIRAMGDEWDLDEASEFLVIAATLLDLKAARLLPAADVEDEEDLALLEVRDLLFARLLQYKAFKEAAAHIAGLESVGSRRYPRAVTLEARYSEALPDLVLGIGPERLAKLALKAMTPKVSPVVSIDHIHMVRVSVREHAALLRDRLRDMGIATFRVLCLDCESTLEVVARFLALLELYREGLVGFDQMQALGELTVRWTGGESSTELSVDEYAGAPAESDPAPPADTPPQPDAPPPAAATDAAGGDAGESDGGDGDDGAAADAGADPDADDTDETNKELPR